VLRSLASGLCLDIPGRVRSGAAVALAACSTAGTQQWSYDQDGLLRSLTDPGLCLDADPTAGTVTLAGCLVHAGEVHYDLTVRGEFLLRWSQGLAVSPVNGEPGARIELTDRDGSARQRWALESTADARAEQSGPNGEGKEPGQGDVPGSGDPKAPAPPEGAPQGDVPPPPTGSPEQNGQSQYAPRAAQVACCDEPAPQPAPAPSAQPASAAEAVQPLVTVVAGVVDTVTDLLPVLR
jgi:hypothetical protein